MDTYQGRLSSRSCWYLIAVLKAKKKKKFVVENLFEIRISTNNAL